jgi:tetratricopeptide (TPR) repeat protein
MIVRRAAAPILLAGLFAFATATAAPPEYTFDTDPIRLGTKAIEEDRDADARVQFEKALAEGYQPAKARHGLATLARLAGHAAEAESLYLAALAARAAEGKGEDYPEARAGLGIALLRAGRDAEAAAAFEAALTSKPKLWEALYGRARLLMKEGRWDEAKILLDQGKGLKGRGDGLDLLHHATALYERGRGNLDAAETAALLASAVNAADPEYGALLAEIYLQKGVPALAIETWERAFAAPDAVPSAAALTTLGGLYRGAKRYNDARDAYLRAITTDSTHVPAFRELADLYRLADQPDKALLVSRKWLEMAPSDRAALLSVSGSALASGQPAVALDAADKAMVTDSLAVDVRLAWARAALQSRDTPLKARGAAVYLLLPDSVRTPSLDAEARFQQGMVDLAQGATDSAVAHLTEAARLDTAAALYPLNLGIALLRARRNAEAIPAFRRALALNATMVLAHVYLAGALALTADLAGAETEYRKALELEPENAAALRGLAFCAIRKSDFSEAARLYQAATAADPGNADGWAGLGNARLGLKDYDAAEAAFQKARAIDPENSTLKKGLELLNNARKSSG